jgi:hypothetical protein
MIAYSEISPGARGGLHDVRREPVGQFAGTLPPDAPVGSYGGGRHRRWQGAGAFAGDPDGQRQGSFADVDREEAMTHDGRGERPRSASQREGRLNRSRAGRRRSTGTRTSPGRG